MPTHDYTKPPRTMPHTFARQEQEIKRLQKELGEANDRIVELTKALDTMNERERQEWARAENAEAWGRRAYKLLFWVEQTVEMDAREIAERLMADAPESVKGGENPSKSAG
jgi:predicted RNase H-like nuclease (RuvC/YqgF family)